MHLIFGNKRPSFQVFNQAKFVIQTNQGKEGDLVDLLPLSFSAVVSHLPITDLLTEMAEL